MLPSPFESWFNLKNYDAMNNKGTKEWTLSVEYRYQLHWLLNNSVEIVKGTSKTTLGDEERLEWFDNTFNEAQMDLGKVRRCTIEPYLLKSESSAKATSEKMFPSCARPADLESLHEVFTTLFECKKIAPLKKYFLERRTNGIFAEDESNISPEFSSLDNTFEKFKNIPIDLLYGKKGEELYDHTLAQTLFFVDLDAPEEKLVESFKKAINKYKKIIELPSTETFTSQNFEKWRKNRLLEYLDLTLFAQRHDIRINNNIIGLTLFPDDYEVTLSEKVRKTIKPQALKLITEEVINALNSQAELAD